MQRRKSWSRQELKPLCKALDRLCKQLDDKYNVNCGGCCFVALCIAKELSKRGIRYGLVLYSDECPDCSISYIRDNILNRRNVFPTGDETTNHYAIKISHIGIINNSDWYDDYRVVNNISPMDIEFIYDNGHWNDDYNTKYNKQVRNTIIKFFKHYEEEHFAEV